MSTVAQQPFLKFALAQITYQKNVNKDEPDVAGYYRASFLYSDNQFDKPMTAVGSTFEDEQAVPVTPVILTDRAPGNLDTTVADHEAVRKQVKKLINDHLYAKGYKVYRLKHPAFPGSTEFEGDITTHKPIDADA
jgi:hypothetical protein